MPLIRIGACVSLQFGFLSAAKNYFVKKNQSRSTTPEVLSPIQLYAAGAFAGVGNSVVSGPVEHIRIRKFIIAFLLQLASDSDRREIPC
jgi:solute carrier family 25 carnitine/acylcarnitine transporter 20/29